ncbi:competence/damage-inducible protein A [Acidithrix ferrooxidans]|uniref:CinA-like protein n=2 Tax=root TaxID=1 RepID=A0A0D8HM48_9ACTN|nr:competence/damage-inducible protein A [Acidithrix ferrooxidans]KJF18998.1 nicotinamide-nucleotide amidohydrolase PncC [Acidithrix ferrooxidans]
MRVEIVAVGTELLLGQIVDTNSTMISQRLADVGLDCFFQAKVGDNLERIKLVLRDALSRSDAVIVCGGLGPTQDDITREAIAGVMGVPLEMHEDIAESIKAIFSSRGRTMSQNNLLQAMVPVGASAITQVRGTAPGLIAPVGRKVIYAAPGVPYELSEMLDRAIIPDLLERQGDKASIVSRVIRCWGLSESALAERLDPLFQEIDSTKAPITLAFLASGIEGIKVRLSARADTKEAASQVISRYEAKVLEVIGDHVFGYDDTTMEAAVGELLLERSLTLAVAESVTGGLVASRIVAVPGASRWFRGGVVSYDTEVKRTLLGVVADDVITAQAVIEMAIGVRSAIKSDVGLAFSGVGGPEGVGDHAVGTVFVGVDLGDGAPFAHELKLPGDRERIRQFSTISGLDLLRRRILKG